MAINPDFSDAWNSRGAALNNLSRFQEALESVARGIALQPESASGWYIKGFSLRGLGRYEEALVSNNRSLQLEPESHQAWLERGFAVYGLGTCEKAIVSASLEFGVHLPLSDSTQISSSNSLKSYQEEALACYEQALQHEPSSFEARYSRGHILVESGHYEDAIADYDQALRLKPNFSPALHGRGCALANLGRYEEAIFNYDQALSLNLNFPDVWISRGFAALYSALYPGNYGWSNPALVAKSLPPELQNPDLDLRGYEGCQISIQEGFKYTPAGTEGWGKLHRALGEAHRLWGNHQENPRPCWKKTISPYEQALNIFTTATFPQARLEVLALLIRTHRALETSDGIVTALLNEGTGLLRRLFTDALSEEQKQRLGLQFASFGQATVDLLVQQGKLVKALETAELDKNWLMTWLLRWQDPDEIPTASYDDMRQLLRPHSAIVYWHLSPDALTTFILRWDKAQPTVISRATDDSRAAIQQIHQLENWIKTWNKNYTVHRQKSKESNIKENSDWQNTLPTELESLAEILNIPALLPHLQNIQNLILVPHRDLHRFPLHSFFPKTNITYLPSLHLGRHLRPASALTPNLLNVVVPDHADLHPLPDASIESHTLDRMLKTRQIPTAQLTQATHQTLTDRLTQPHNILHFNGHAGYHNDNPKLSSLGLQGDDRLTTIDLTKLPTLSQYNLITLTSCETAITGNQTLTAEYVGLISGFLSHGIPHILSTLWTIESAASTLFILQFYRQLLKGQSPSQSLTHSQTWLQTVTVRQLRRHYSYWIDRLPAEDEIRPFLKTWRNKLGTMEPNQTRYSHPYYWAAFTLSGRG